ncbi:MAG: hypothetical protein KME17_02605 [Cyanosarcina radialis HA8281-LM2]|nr:hypothetical protein [Cyanosarcina radialis HA8281-LM2]
MRSPSKSGMRSISIEHQKSQNNLVILASIVAIAKLMRLVLNVLIP